MRPVLPKRHPSQTCDASDSFAVRVPTIHDDGRPGVRSNDWQLGAKTLHLRHLIGNLEACPAPPEVSFPVGECPSEIAGAPVPCGGMSWGEHGSAACCGTSPQPDLGAAILGKQALLGGRTNRQKFPFQAVNGLWGWKTYPATKSTDVDVEKGSDCGAPALDCANERALSDRINHR